MIERECSTVIRERCPRIQLAYAENQLQDYLLCGPLREPGESKLVGSIILVAGGSAEGARASVAAGPCIESGFLSRDYREISHAGGLIRKSADAVRDEASY